MRSNRGPSREELVWRGFLLVLVSVISLSFLANYGSGDVGFWTNWATATRDNGLVRGYAAARTDYPPLSVLILGLSERVSRAVGASTVLGVKASIAAFLFLTSLTVYAHASNALLTAAFHLALVPNSLALGYIDVFYAPTLILALSMLKRSRFTTFAILFAVSFMIKWQCVVILPFTWLYVFRAHRQYGVRAALTTLFRAVVAPMGLVIGVTFAVFGLEVLWAFGRAVSQPYLSPNAMNLNWMSTYALHLFAPETYGSLSSDGTASIIYVAPQNSAWLSRLLFLCGYLAALYVCSRRDNGFETLIVSSLLGFLAYFTFAIGVHENHLFVGTLLALLLYAEDSRRAAVAAFIVLFSNFNLYVFYGIEGQTPQARAVLGMDTALIGSALWVSFVGTLFALEIAPIVRARSAPA